MLNSAAAKQWVYLTKRCLHQNLSLLNKGVNNFLIRRSEFSNFRVLKPVSLTVGETPVILEFRLNLQIVPL